VDMILSGMTIIPVRNMKAAFVGPYYESGKAFLTKYDKIASAKDSSEVNNTAITLAALRGSTSQAFVEALIPQAKLTLTANYDEAVQLVIQGKVDALVADFTRDSHGLSPDDLTYFDLVIDTGKVSRDSAVRILVEAVGALMDSRGKGPTAAELQVDSVWEKDVSYEFERVARLRG